MQKSKVLSVRLSVEALQSCFDLCEALGMPANGASGAIARSIETLTLDLRKKQTLPSYAKNELAVLLQQYIGRVNPTSMQSLEKLNNFSNFGSAQERSFTDQDFAPLPIDGRERQEDRARPERDPYDIQKEKEEYEDLLEEQIRLQMQSDEADLLSKILVGG